MRKEIFFWMEEKQVSVKLQAVFPGCVEPGLRGAVVGEVQKVGQADPTGALGSSCGV